MTKRFRDIPDAIRLPLNLSERLSLCSINPAEISLRAVAWAVHDMQPDKSRWVKPFRFGRHLENRGGRHGGRQGATMAGIRQTLDFVAILILLAFFLLGLMGNREGEGQFFLLLTLAVASIMLVVWIFNGLKAEFLKIYEDWRAISVAQARKQLRVPDTLDLATAVLALQRKDYKTAAAILWLSSERGDATAQYVLSGLFRTGRGVPRSRAEALKWLRRSAEQGLTEAEADLGEEYVKDNPIQAVEWLKRAAVKGDSLSQHRLGSLYERGRGVQKNAASAADWYRQAAEGGHELAQRALGTLYLEGRGVEVDMVQAYAWLRLAAEKGDRKAAHLLYKAASSLPVEAQANSEWLVGEWRSKIQQALHAPTPAERQRLRKMAEQSVFARIRQALAAAETAAADAVSATARTAAPVAGTDASATAHAARAQGRASTPQAAPEEDGAARTDLEARSTGRRAGRGLARRSEAPEQRKSRISSPAADAAAKTEGLGSLRDRIAQRAERSRTERGAEPDGVGTGAQNDPRAERVRRSAAQLSSRLSRSRRGEDGPAASADPSETPATDARAQRLADRANRRGRREPSGGRGVEERLANLPGGRSDHKPTDTMA